HPEEVKDIYLQEGTVHLRRKLEIPETSEEEIKISDIPKTEMHSMPSPAKKNWSRPHWWSSMYNRDAKAIHAQVWKELMRQTTWQEVLSIILKSETNKAAGI